MADQPRSNPHRSSLRPVSCALCGSLKRARGRVHLAKRPPAAAWAPYGPSLQESGGWVDEGAGLAVRASSVKDMRRLALEARRRLLRMHFESRIGHLGGNLSALDALLSLHHQVMGPR